MRLPLIMIVAGVLLACGPKPRTRPQVRRIEPTPSAEPALRTQTGERVACGDGACDAGSEVCCASESRGVVEGIACVAGSEPSSVDADQATCRVHSSAVLLYCDDTSDCGPDEVCCVQHDPLRASCQSRSELANGTCDRWRLCQASHECPAEAPECRHGACRPIVRPSCGDASCTGEETCCFNRAFRVFECVSSGPWPDNPCARGTHVQGSLLACRSSRECFPGQRCCASTQRGLYCAQECEIYDTPTCASDADCEGVVLPGAEGMMVPATACGSFVEHETDPVGYCVLPQH